MSKSTLNKQIVVRLNVTIMNAYSIRMEDLRKIEYERISDDHSNIE